MSRVDHAEASSKFIEVKDHADFHDKRLWDPRKKRDSVSEAIPQSIPLAENLKIFITAKPR